MMVPSKWDLRFLRLAAHISEWSKDPSTKVGAVIVDHKNRVVSLGYNGFPTRVEDRPDLLGNREAKLARTVHADANAILFAARPLVACTIYTYPFPPCSACAALIIQAGIHRVVSARGTDTRWEESVRIAAEMFREANVTLDIYDPGDIR